MMKNIFRLVSPEILEVYNLRRDGGLIFLKTTNPNKVKFKKIKILLISAYYKNWDTIRIENIAYKPKPNTNLFSSKSLIRKDDLILTNTFYNQETGYWAQAWTSSQKLNSIWKITSKKVAIFPEALNVKAPVDATLWKSGPRVLSYSKAVGFSLMIGLDANNQLAAETLDGFTFNPNVGFHRRRPKSFFGLLCGLAVMVCSLIFALQISVKENLNFLLNPPSQFENTLVGISALEYLQTDVPDGTMESLVFDQRKQSLTLIFSSKIQANDFFKKFSLRPNPNEDGKIEKIENTVVFSDGVEK